MNNARRLVLFFVFYIGGLAVTAGESSDINLLFAKEIKKAKQLLCWDERVTSNVAFKSEDIDEVRSYIEREFAIGNNQSAANDRVNYLIKADIDLVVSLHWAPTRVEAENNYIFRLSSTNMSVESRLHGFTLKNDYLGDYAYIHAWEGWTNPAELFFGYGNLIVSIRVNNIRGIDPETFPPIVVETAEKIADFLKEIELSGNHSDDEPSQDDAAFADRMQRAEREIKRILNWEEATEPSSAIKRSSALWDFLRIRELLPHRHIDKDKFISGKESAIFFDANTGIRVEFYHGGKDNEFYSLFLAMAMTSMPFDLRYGRLRKNVYMLGDVSYSNRNGEILWQIGDVAVWIRQRGNLDKESFLALLRLAGQIDWFLQNPEPLDEDGEPIKPPQVDFSLDKVDSVYFEQIQNK